MPRTAIKIMVHFNRTKVIATVGPVSNSHEVLWGLVQAGVDVFRFNFSHESHEASLKVIQHIRKINEKEGVHISLLADLQGPKLRIGEIENGSIQILPEDIIYITTEKCIGNNEKIYITYKHFPQDVKKGDKVLLDDGKLELEVMESNHFDLVKTKVTYGGILSSKKGVNLPNTKISMPSLTDKDLIDLDFALENGFNWIALSFVRSAQDIVEIKKIIEDKKSFAKVIAKIEKPEAVEAIDEIIASSDAIMVARGDLGVEVPMARTPLIQKEIVKKCIIAAKPVIIATQIMESMILSSKPIRAEITDVANAVIDGADALMLSGETAMGNHPVKVVETIEKIVTAVEAEQIIYNKNLKPKPKSKSFLSDAICFNACKIADEVGAKAIIGMTNSGYTAFMISSYRPKAKIFIFTDNHEMINTLNLTWGVRAFHYDKYVSTDETIEDVQNILKEKGLVRSGDIVINTGSMPMGKRQMTNMLKVSKIV